MTHHIEVEVVFGDSEQQHLDVILCPEGTQAIAVVQQSSIKQYDPAFDMSQADLGIFGQPIHHNHPVGPKERIEVYRPLKIDPKEARKLRAARKKGQKHGSD